jgi:hypothetical protein
MTMITWTKGEYSTIGTAGGAVLFTIAWRNVKADPQWFMTTTLTTLPGLSKKVWKHDDDTALQRAAETILARWVSKVVGDLTVTVIAPAEKDGTPGAVLDQFKVPGGVVVELVECGDEMSFVTAEGKTVHATDIEDDENTERTMPHATDL